jgi:flagellar hook-associated protein 2
LSLARILLSKGMGSIVSSGVGSGLDVATLVQQLVQAEGGPKTVRLNAEEAKVQAKLSALGTLRSALATFRDTVTTLKDLAKFQGRKVTLSTPDFVQAVATSSAVPGRYAIEVEQLATAHKVQSTGSPAPTTVIGTGTLRIAAAGQNFDIVIDPTNNTLAGIAAEINDSAASARVFATVVTGATEARLTITARATGAANALTITESGGDAGLTALVSGFTPVQAALDAQALIEGIAVTSGTNTISGAIAGVDITLVEANEEDGDTTEIVIEYDRTAARKTIDDLVKGYNAVVDAIKSVSGYNIETKESGPLFGDAGVRNIVHQLRRVLTSNVAGLTGPFDVLGEIGISAELNGKLSVDGAELDAAFAADFDAIGELFATDDVGIAVKLDELLAPYLDSDGVFDSRAAGLKSSIEAINDRRQVLNQRLAALQARYTKEFNALDSLLSQLQGTSNFLTQQLSRLPGSAPLQRRDP